MAKIMLVEDDNNLGEIYQARMMAEGYTVVAARDGEEALALAAKEKPDLIISDVMMPKISGFEMLDILRNTQGLKDTKVIMLTALGQAEDKTRADSLGADRYLVKSQVTLEDIVKSAQELLGEGTATASNQTTQPSTPAAAAASVAEPAAAPAAPVQSASEPVAPTPAIPPIPNAPTAATPVSIPVAQAPQQPRPTPTMPSAARPPMPQPSRPQPQQPATNTPAVASIPTPDTQSNAQEAAAVQQQIATFAAAPTFAASTPPLSPQTQIPADPTTAPAAASNRAANDDKLVTDAVNNLVAQAATQGADNSVAAPSSAQPATPAAAAASVTEPAAAPAAQTPTQTPDETNASAPVANKKVIRPIETDDKKPSLDSLLAAEEAKDAAGAPAQPIIGDEPAQPVHQPGNIVAPAGGAGSQNDTGIDPSTIAL